MPGFLLGGELGFFEVSGFARPVFMAMFAILAFGFAVAGATHNTALPLTLIFVGVGLGLEAIGAAAGIDALGVAGAWLLIAASLLAMYMLIEKFFWRTMGRRVIPLGAAWIAGSADSES